MWSFVEQHLQEDPDKLRLRFAGAPDDIRQAITQIDCRRRARHKLPTLTASDSRFIFPSTLSAEQCTSEALARIHAHLVPQGSRLLDLTCGLGIDAMTMARKCRQVTAIERNTDTLAAVRQNLKTLEIGNMETVHADSAEWVADCRQQFDVIFADPARRSQHNKRLFSLADCSPDIPALLPRLLQLAPTLIVKASPMLDISELIRTLPSLSRVMVLCLQGECKELLLVIERDCSQPPVIEAIDATGEAKQSLCYRAGENDSQDIRYAEAAPHQGEWLYEPNAGVMKTGAWGVLCRNFPDLQKLHPNTQLFLSGREIPDFPGRRLQIEQVLTGREARSVLKGRRLNVVSRNHPLSPSQLCKKYGVHEGGNDFLYALTAHNGPLLLLCRTSKFCQNNNVY